MCLSTNREKGLKDRRVLLTTPKPDSLLATQPERQERDCSGHLSMASDAKARLSRVREAVASHLSAFVVPCPVSANVRASPAQPCTLFRKPYRQSPMGAPFKPRRGSPRGYPHREPRGSARRGRLVTVQHGRQCFGSNPIRRTWCVSLPRAWQRQ